MTYKEVKKDELIIEYGSEGKEFYLILEGETEVIIPDKDSDDFKVIDNELKLILKRLKINLESYNKQFKEMLDTKEKMKTQRRLRRLSTIFALKNPH